ncbi:MAG TPA: acyl carrier protein [Caldithrix abyssi]|uniref:Acyl carrier protein n=1 Tax=Caldithrix abyssi TaxID=187145 RepID=A0A7V4U1D8_CALAY|nr:acyl carrier protein [Caldithrix abyssi]
MDVKEKIVQFFEENFMVNLKDDGIGDDDSFLESGVIDSTGVLELVTFLEENFGIKVEDDEIVPENLDSINNLIRYIQQKTQ